MSVAFSPDGQRVLTGSRDKTAKLWDMSGREMQTFSGHASSVLSVAFSPDGQRVLTGSSDNTAKLWAIGQSDKKQAAQTWQLTETCYAVAFSPTGERVALGSGQHFSPYFCGLCNLDKKGYVAELTVQQRIENELMREEDCLALLRAGATLSRADTTLLTGCAKYFLQKNADFNYVAKGYDRANLSTALRLAVASARLGPQGEGAVMERSLRSILAKIEADSVAVAQAEAEDAARREAAAAERKKQAEAAAAERAAYEKSIAGLNRDSLENVEQLADRLLTVQNLAGQLQNNPADTTLAKRLANACVHAAWSQLFTRDYAGAVQSVERGLQVWPAMTWGYTNLALGHLLQGHWPEAEKIYTQWKGQSWKTSGFGDMSQYATFGEAFLADLADLERMGIRHPDFAKARALLGAGR
ncbi:MAG TPA: hypothetical protein PK858_02405 [Saprospiraceae bacterium]|nr:hypothetical protein [Saprospiraceae bacterium]